MSSEHRYIKLKEVADIIMGQSPEGEHCNKDGVGMPLLNGPTEFGQRFPIPVQFTTTPKRIAQKDELLFCVRGSTTGRMNWADQEYAIGRGIAAIHAKDMRSRYYVKAFIDYKLNELLNIATGSTFPNVSKPMIENLTVTRVSLEEQRNIASIYSSLDDKIELNNRMNKVLEQIAQAIFKQWFVDFEFPNEHGEPYKSSGGEMEWCTELGKEIPKSWRIKHLKELSDLITKGTTPTTLGRSFTSKGINFIKAESITNAHNFDTNKFAFIDEETHLNLKRSIIKEGDILFTIAGTLGRYAIATNDILPANTNQAVAIIRANSSIINPYFILCYFLSGEHQSFYSARTQQAVQANLSLTTIGELPLVIPPERVLIVFYRIIKEIFVKIDNTVKQNNKLSELRDTLLPKLMSGEIDVSNVEL